VGRVILLDTCALLWLVSDRAALSALAARAISEASQVFVSAASAMEIGIKARQGKLSLPSSPSVWWAAAVERLRLVDLPMSSTIVLRATGLPASIVVDGKAIEHKDPGDRLIAATGIHHALAVVTPDPRLAAFPGVHTVW
jgi:PIN domain nuclease of toxin-antitoxin system